MVSFLEQHCARHGALCFPAWWVRSHSGRRVSGSCPCAAYPSGLRVGGMQRFAPGVCFPLWHGSAPQLGSWGNTPQLPLSPYCQNFHPLRDFSDFSPLLSAQLSSIKFTHVAISPPALPQPRPRREPRIRMTWPQRDICKDPHFPVRSCSRGTRSSHHSSLLSGPGHLPRQREHLPQPLSCLVPLASL